MASAPINKVQDKNGDQFFPITHQQAVINDDGDNLVTILGGKQPLDADLTAIAALPAASIGVLKKTGDGTWAIDTDTFYTSANSNKSDVAWAASRLNVGYQPGQITANRAEISCISKTDVPADIWLGANNGAYWSINCRDSSAGYDLSIYNANRGHLFRINSDTGNIGIGTTTPSSRLAVDGNITATGTITPGSDSRIKDNQQDIVPEEAMEILAQLKPKTWDWNERTDHAGKKSAGLVAQEVAEVVPEAVVVGEALGFKDFHSLNYNAIQGYEIAAIKGLIEEIKTLREEIANLRAKCE